MTDPRLAPALVSVLALAARRPGRSDGPHGPLSWIANRTIDAVDINEILTDVDLNAQLARVDLNAVLADVDLNALLADVDLDALLADVDVDLLLDRVDVDALLDRVDVNRLLDRVDPDRLLDRVNPDRLLDRVDPNPLLDRVDPDRLLDRVDPDRLLDRVDVDRLMDRVDIKAIVDQAGIADIVRESTGAVAGSALDVFRRQLVAVDTLVERTTWRLLGRDTSARPTGPGNLGSPELDANSSRRQVTGDYAGPVSRALAFTLDILIVFWSFTLGIAGISWLLAATNLVDNFTPGPIVGFVLLASYAFTYEGAGLTMTGRTIGKAIIGLKVVSRSGKPIRGWEAFVRTITLPLSFLTLALGILVVLISPRRLTLHDWLARTAEVYDWGDRPAELPAPISAYLSRKGVEGQIVD